MNNFLYVILLLFVGANWVNAINSFTAGSTILNATYDSSVQYYRCFFSFVLIYSFDGNGNSIPSNEFTIEASISGSQQSISYQIGDPIILTYIAYAYEVTFQTPIDSSNFTIQVTEAGNLVDFGSETTVKCNAPPLTPSIVQPTAATVYTTNEECTFIFSIVYNYVINSVDIPQSDLFSITSSTYNSVSSGLTGPSESTNPQGQYTYNVALTTPLIKDLTDVKFTYNTDPLPITLKTLHCLNATATYNTTTSDAEMKIVDSNHRCSFIYTVVLDLNGATSPSPSDIYMKIDGTNVTITSFTESKKTSTQAFFTATLTTPGGVFDFFNTYALQFRGNIVSGYGAGSGATLPILKCLDTSTVSLKSSSPPKNISPLILLLSILTIAII